MPKVDTANSCPFDVNKPEKLTYTVELVYNEHDYIEFVMFVIAECDFDLKVHTIILLLKKSYGLKVSLHILFLLAFSELYS